MMSTRTWRVLAIVSVCVALAAAAIGGSDFDGSSTYKVQVASAEDLMSAIGVIRDFLESAAPPKRIEVNLKGGIYELTKPLELTEETIGAGECEIVFQAEEGEEVRLIGGYVLPVETAGPGVQTINLPDLALDLSAFLCPEDLHAKAEFYQELFVSGPGMELFIDGQAMTLARYPNDRTYEGWRETDYPYDRNDGFEHSTEYLRMSQVVDLIPGELAEKNCPCGKAVESEEDLVQCLNCCPSGEITFYDPLDPAGADEATTNRWKNWSQQIDVRYDAWAYGFWATTYSSDAFRIAQVDPLASTMRLSLGSYTNPQTEFGCNQCYDNRKVRTRCNVGSDDDGNPVYGGGDNSYLGSLANGDPTKYRFFAFNIESELDQPGEWYLNRESGELSFRPPTENFEEAIVSISENVIRLDGVRDVTFKNITIEASQGHAITMTSCHNCSIEGCTVRNTGGWGIVIQGGQNCHVVGCEIRETAAGGVFLGSGEKKGCSSDPTVTVRDTYKCGELSDARRQGKKSNHKVENCHIHHFARWHLTHRVAIEITGVGMTVTHNLIHDGPHGAIWFHHGFGHTIEGNEIYDVGQETSDCGAIMADRDWASRGTTIQHNYIHHLEGVVGVYLDDGFSGTAILDNTFYQIRNFGILIGGGRDNTVQRNLFLDCGRVLHVDNRLMTWGSDHVECVDEGGILHDGELRKKLERMLDEAEPSAWAAFPGEMNALQALRALQFQSPDGKGWLEQAKPTGNVVTGNTFTGNEWSDVLEIVYHNWNGAVTTPDCKRKDTCCNSTDHLGPCRQSVVDATNPESAVPLSERPACPFVEDDSLVTIEYVEANNTLCPTSSLKQADIAGVGLYESDERQTLPDAGEITVTSGSGAVGDDITISISGASFRNTEGGNTVVFWKTGESYPAVVKSWASNELGVVVPEIPMTSEYSLSVGIEVDLTDGVSYFVPFTICRKEFERPDDALELPIGEAGTAYEDLELGVRGGTLRVAVLSGPIGWNPYTTDHDPGTAWFTNRMFRGLVEIDPITGEIVPSLAKAFDPSADRLTYTFHLRQGVKWSDGEPITADDVVFTYNDIILNMAVDTAVRDTLKLPDGTFPACAKVDDYTVTFTMSTTFRPILHSLTFKIVPQHVLEARVSAGLFDEAWSLGMRASLVVNGPWIPESFVESGSVTLRRNPHYWVYDSAGTRLPYFDRVIVWVRPSSEVRLTQFFMRDIDVHDPFPNSVDDLLSLSADGEITVLDTDDPTYGVTWLMLNGNAGSSFLIDAEKRALYADPAFRKAVAHCIDRELMIARVLLGRGVPQWSPVSIPSPFFAGRSGHGGSITGPTTVGILPDYSISQARLLLDGLGIVDQDGDGHRDLQSGNQLAMEIAYPSSRHDPILFQLAEVIRSGLLSAGLNVRFRLFDTAEDLVTILDESTVDLVVFGSPGSPEPNDMRKDIGPCGVFHTCDSPSERWLRESAETLDEDEAFFGYGRLQRWVATQLEFIFLVNRTFQYAYYNHVGNASAASPLSTPSDVNGMLMELCFRKCL